MYSEGFYGSAGSQAEGVVATVCCALSSKNECVVGTALGHLLLWRGTVYCIVMYSDVVYCDLLYRSMMHCTVMYCAVLYCIVMHCSALCIVLYSF
jgi:hypothetical protein